MASALTVVDFKKNITKMIESRDLTLPSSVSPEAFRNAAIIAYQDNHYLRECTPDSVFRALRQVAGMGLVPDNREAAIVPFKGKAVANPMVYGLIKVARQSGQVVTLWADLVYDTEDLTFRIENGERVWDHIRKDGSSLNPLKRSGNIDGAYAVAKLLDGTVEIEPMGIDQIEKRRKSSPNQKGEQPTGIWKDWYEEMAKKTVIRALCKRLPMSSEDRTRILERDPTLMDVDEARDITPRESTEERLRRIAREREGGEEATPEGEGETLEANIFKPDLVDYQSPAYQAGADSAQAGAAITQNPHTYASQDDYCSWHQGFLDAKTAAQGDD